MKDINNVILCGRLTKDALIHKFNEESAVVQFTIAVNTTTKKDGQYSDVANFFDCKIFGKNKDKLTSLLVKGKQVAVSGYLTQERWEKDGQKNSRIIVNVLDIQLLGGASKEGSQNGGFSEDLPYDNNTFDDGNCPF